MNVRITVVAVLLGTFLNRQMFVGGTKKWSQIYVIWKCRKQETLQGNGKGFCITLSNARDPPHKALGFKTKSKRKTSRNFDIAIFFQLNR